MPKDFKLVLSNIIGFTSNNIPNLASQFYLFNHPIYLATHCATPTKINTTKNTPNAFMTK
jgi:hypothetical protein